MQDVITNHLKFTNSLACKLVSYMEFVRHGLIEYSARIQVTAGIISTCSLCRTQWFLLYFASDTCCIERVSQSELVDFAANCLNSTILGWLLAVCVRDKVEIDVVRVPTRPGKPGKMRVHLENLEISWNFEKFNKYHGKMT